MIDITSDTILKGLIIYSLKLIRIKFEKARVFCSNEA